MYNYRLSRARQKIEYTFEMLAARFVNTNFSVVYVGYSHNAVGGGCSGGSLYPNLVRVVVCMPKLP